MILVKKRFKHWPPPDKEVLILNGYFPLILHKKNPEIREYIGIFFVLSKQRISQFKTALYGGGLTFEPLLFYFFSLNSISTSEFHLFTLFP